MTTISVFLLSGGIVTGVLLAMSLVVSWPSLLHPEQEPARSGGDARDTYGDMADALERWFGTPS